MSARALPLTLFALLCFAANSVLCRLALGQRSIDPASFTSIRLLSGAVVLAIIVAWPRRSLPWKVGGSWWSGFFLFLYAIAFSLAYLGLTAGTGALILFGCVQMTMISVGLFRGDRPGVFEWVGLVVAFLGLIYLVLPGLQAPPLLAAISMAVAGVAWGLYSLRGRGSKQPEADTAGNFAWAVPLAVLTLLVGLPWAYVSPFGAVLAVLSGALFSGGGYVVWYAALRDLAALPAAVVQLAVPLVAAVGGVLAIPGETLSSRFWAATVLVLGGVLAVILGKSRKVRA